LPAEYREVPEQLRSSGKVTTDQRRTLVSGIAAFVAEARVVVPTRSLALCRDPADDTLLECCQAARASVLLTGDRDLLDLAEIAPRTAGVRRLAILTPRAFIERAPSRGGTKR
jgi:predicted nucleic acid-binding protein